ncbi:DUF2637 domain-containing protein [Saccharothrix deserti]|uniref:DUF2637 domain-containing protein n=1 Tax=Saccharothrix deserti TaxID=2593674 RepID=UPI00131B9D7C|nr:DUF2637 domain-containing protein [Saccharothrix deserti]
MTAPNPELVTQIRQALEAARAAGEPPPGRPTLVRLTGATDHAVRKALAELATEDTSLGDTSTPLSPATPPARTTDGRLVAWAGFVFGSVMSIAANVLHTWLPAEHHPTGWSPGLPPQIGAAVWPIGLLLSVEVLSRIPWPKGWQWTLARFGGTGTVALGSAVISYGHLRDLLLAWHYGPLAAAVGPLVLDGLMVISGFALLAMSRVTSDINAATVDGEDDVVEPT